MPPPCLIVDAANVVGARPDGWWRDRAGSAARLICQLRDFAERQSLHVVVVLEGAARAGAAPRLGPPLTVVHAEREGDAEILARVTVADGPVRVVTADRTLRAHVTAAGAEVVGPSWLRARLDGRCAGFRVAGAAGVSRRGAER